VLIPEIDGPGHVNAALASYADLNCNGVAPPLYTGVLVGFSSLCIGKAITNMFVKDVLGELAAITPGPYLHVGGDEAKTTSATDYKTFINDTQAAVQATGKLMIGWADISQTTLMSTTIAQHWDFKNPMNAVNAAQQHIKLILSPADRTYLDMKYDMNTALGLNWAGYVEVDQAYSWDPATLVVGVGEGDLVGIESPLWSETLTTIADIEYMAFPRLAGHAEIGWSPASGRSFAEYRNRIGAHGPRLTAMGVHFYASPLIPWQ
jgi:hexosaminidase